MSRLALGGVLAWSALACEPAPPDSSGGVALSETKNESGASCGFGLAVVLSDYVSTNVAVIDLAGKTLSGSILSSGSESPLLHAPLGGDVALPSRLDERELVLLDRYPTAVLTFLDLASGEVRGQLDVGRGFAANPQDYLEIDERTAFVTRYGANPDPDAASEDRGDDVLVVDPVELEVRGAISFEELRADGFLVRPGQMERVLDWVVVSASGYQADFKDAADGRLLWIDPVERELVRVTEIRGLKNCGALAVSPSGDEIAVGCSGLVDGSDDPRPADSGLVFFRVERGADGAPSIEETRRILASDGGHGPLGFSVAYADPDTVLYGTYGATEGDDAGRPDRVHVLGLEDGTAQIVLASEGEPFTLGEIRCVSACGVCFVTDAGRGRVHRFEIRAGEATHERIAIDEDIGLPPRRIGSLGP